MAAPYISDIIYNGFRLLEQRFIDEVNANCLYFEHVKSGARLFKIMADDANKTFCIGFKTLPGSDNGAPHIMEHSVLNGSKNFQVKSPFDVLLKGSLSTFLNAFTSKDYTMYPVASINDKDYFNLMYVYLDAVFNPLIYNDFRILQQEGWHYELTGKEQPVSYTGVVYNEMKGAFSDPHRELWYQVFRHLFPDSPYGFESGGHPDAIPTLTYQDFIAFHQKYYHPGNSYIYLYGNADLEKELAFINTAYLDGFQRTSDQITLADQEPFNEMKEATEYYPVVEGADCTNQTFLTWNFVAGQNTDLALTMALDILCEVLVNQESAPVRLALQEAGIGQDVSASSSNFKQHALQIVAMNANPGDKQRFLGIIKQTLAQVVSDGLDKQEIEGVINRMEFRLREGDDAQKGLTYLNHSLARWFFSDDPFSGLQYEKTLREVKKALTENFLEKIIETYFLGNPHSLLLSLEPAPGLDKTRSGLVEKELAEYKASLTDPEINAMVDGTRDLIAFQQRDDSAEALASVPSLKISDIEPNTIPIEMKEEFLDEVSCISHSQFTNGVIYLNLCFDLQVVPQDLIPFAALLSNLIGNLDTEHYTYGELNKTLNIHTGGFYTSLRTYAQGLSDQSILPKFMVSSKTMHYKTEKLLELTSEILTGTSYRDANRIRTLLSRHQSHLDAQMKGNGFQVANRRLSSYFSNQGMINELTGGASYYWFVTDLLRDFDLDTSQVISKLEQVAKLLFNRENLVVSVTCARNDQELFYQYLQPFLLQLPAGGHEIKKWKFETENRNEGLLSASNVQYVIQGYNFKKLGYVWNGRMGVLNQILSTDWLQTHIRVIGGAYGGFSSISPSGNLTFNSYRDPNLGATLETFKNTVEYLQTFNADEQAMTRYIIGTIAEMDTPLTPSQIGNKALSMYFTKLTHADRQHDRDDVLSTDPSHIRDFSRLIADVLKQDAVCVYGNAEKLTSEKHLFKTLISL